MAEAPRNFLTYSSVPTGPELRPASEPIWPPQSWWDERGVMPSTQRRIGQAQAFAGRALDVFGIPSAILSRLSPQADKALSDVTAAHPTASGAGNVASMLAAGRPIRAAGNKLAEKGYGLGAQAGADAATVLGLGMASDTIRHGEPFGANALVASHAAAPAVMMNRLFMPNLPDSVLKRGALGAAAGAITGAVPAYFESNYAMPVVNAAIGGLLAAGGRPSPALRPYADLMKEPKYSQARDRARDISLFLPAAIAGGAAVQTLTNSDTLSVPFDQMSQAGQDFYMTQNIPEWSMGYPTTRPIMPGETSYADVVYPAGVPDEYTQPVNNLMMPMRGR
jgi:hypothetical protein